jgi:hypothetical protein
MGGMPDRHELPDLPDGVLTFLLIGGEAGIGKTRVAEELVGEARAWEVRVVWGRCHEGEGAPAYWPSSTRRWPASACSTP